MESNLELFTQIKMQQWESHKDSIHRTIVFCDLCLAFGQGYLSYFMAKLYKCIWPTFTTVVLYARHTSFNDMYAPKTYLMTLSTSIWLFSSLCVVWILLIIIKIAMSHPFIHQLWGHAVNFFGHSSSSSRRPVANYLPDFLGIAAMETHGHGSFQFLITKMGGHGTKGQFLTASQS